MSISFEPLDITYLKGIGPKRAAVLQKHGLDDLSALLHFFPRRYIDRRDITRMDELRENQEATVIGKVESAGIRRARKPYFCISLSDGHGVIEAVWFNSLNFFKNLFSIGEWVSLSGKVTFFRGYSMSHPDYDRLGELDMDAVQKTGVIIPLYPGTDAFKKAGINTHTFRRVFKQIFDKKLVRFEEHLPEEITGHYGFPDLEMTYRNMHVPDDPQLLDAARGRFIYEEFFFLQILFALHKKHAGEKPAGMAMRGGSPKLKALYRALPFELTGAQKRVIREIHDDMHSEKPMNRLLQGDVGAGKTLVALMAALIAIDNGFQVAMMAPTEILAEQHYLTVKRLLEPYGVEVRLLVGGQSVRLRREILARIQTDEPLFVVGTHAVAQEKVSFSRLGLVIIDEQHRFGVMQRGALMYKGHEVDTLVMTATPIPRTLAMTAYGSLDVSVMDELPKSRKPIRTVWRYDNQAGKMYQFILERVRAGEQAYIVYPLVEESEKMDLRAAAEAYEQLKTGPLRGVRVGLLHGRMKSVEKEQVMKAFTAGELDVLVATTVIEVGVDVPRATIIVIEHAERFGLAQLHQLRGRVGRGGLQSYCILKTPYNIGETARERIRIMTESNDGFLIAEKDLELRGWGDFFGTRQSGMPAFNVANPIRDREVLEKARHDAFQLVEKDPHLRLPEHKALRKKVAAEYKKKIKIFNIS